MNNIFKIITLAVVVSMFATACVTRSRRDYGYVDTGQTVTPQASYLAPVNPNGMITLPNGQVVPAQPGAMYPATPGTSQYAMNGSGRITYEHNSEEFDANTIINGIGIGLGAFYLGTAGAYNIDRMANPSKYYRHHYRRW